MVICARTGSQRSATVRKGEGGRPKGARNKLGEAFLAALHADFQEHGIAAIVKVREEKAEAYLKVIASILPRDLNLNVSPLEALSDDELMKRIRELEEGLRSFLDEAEGHLH